MNTYGTRLGILKQTLKLNYKELLARLNNCTTDRSLRNYIENKTQIPGDIISMVATSFPEISQQWWHSGEGEVLKDPAYRTVELRSEAAEPLSIYGAVAKGETITIPASELFKALFKDMAEVNRLLQSRLEYYEVFIKNMDKYKI